ncbi:penicillin-binding protein activator [bacterium]|nr:penicillin-binding protein activator [bacterium]
MKKLRVTSSLICILFLTHCASQQVNSLYSSKYDSPKASRVEPEARANFMQAEKYFFAREYDKALPIFQNIKNKLPNGKAGQLASYRIGSIFYYQKDYKNSSKEFENFLSRFPQSEITFDVTYNWAAAEFSRENPEKANQVLSRLKLTDVYAQGPKRAEIVFQLAAQVSKALGNHSEAILAYLAELQLPLSESSRQKLDESIYKTINQIQVSSELRDLLKQVREPRFRDKISNRIAILSLENEQSSQPLTPPTPVAQSSQFSLEVPFKNQSLISGSSGDKGTIGVVLPLTGKFANYGKKALDAILLASKSFLGAGDDNVRIVIEDSRSNPLIAANAVDKLARDDQAMAVIGPLSWKESIYAADKAQELGVLNISLSGKEGISERGAYIFQNALTPKIQLDSLVSHCINNLKFSRFAILAPENNFGREYGSSFWNSVVKFGGKVVAYDSYDPEEKDFQKNVQELVGLNPKHRLFEMSRIATYKKEQKEKTGKEPKVKLKPIIDFDAIFIPDSPKAVAQIAANLAYYDVKGVTLLGTTEWNSEQLYRRGGRYVEGALFPGFLNTSTPNLNQSMFIKSYNAAYGSNPDLLASQAFEATNLILTALKNSPSSDRNELVNFLSQQKSFPSPLGSDLSFEGSRVAKRNLPIFKLEGNGAIVQQ